MTMTTNPLQQFFRQPAIYLRLPSGGQFWPPGSVDIPQTGELPVFPMTAADEITYRTPDALFNGQAVVDVVQSCIPAIKNAWAIPSIDLNPILVAIRIASYGHEMEIGTTCPACSTNAEFSLDLRSVLDQMRAPDYTTALRQGDLEIAFHPMSYQQQNASNLEQFESQQIMRSVPDSGLPEREKVQQMSELIKTITRLTIRALTASIASVRTPHALVTDPAHIQEWLENCDRALFTEIRNHAIKLRTDTELRPMDLTCRDCGHRYEQGLTLDMASFFELAS
jgi:hypothetical protein